VGRTGGKVVFLIALSRDLVTEGSER
jgi:hypothetical protein